MRNNAAAARPKTIRVKLTPAGSKLHFHTVLVIVPRCFFQGRLVVNRKRRMDNPEVSFHSIMCQPSMLDGD